MIRHRTKKLNGKWAVLKNVGGNHFAPIKGEVFDTEAEASTRRDELKRNSK